MISYQTLGRASTLNILSSSFPARAKLDGCGIIPEDACRILRRLNCDRTVDLKFFERTSEIVYDDEALYVCKAGLCCAILLGRKYDLGLAHQERWLLHHSDLCRAGTASRLRSSLHNVVWVVTHIC